MTDMLTLIVNPIAGNGLAQKTHERARAFLSGRAIEFSSFVTRAPGEAEALCRSLAGKSGQAVAVLGGDGTLNEVVNGLAQSEITCLLVPCGTGNDFAKAMKLPKDPISALAAQLDAPDGYIDLGRMNDRIFANVSGIGFDVEVLRQTVRFKRLGRGILPYLCGVIAALFRFSPLHARVSLDGGLEAELRLTILSIGNGQYIAGGMKAVPNAVIDDGLFDAIAVEGIDSRLKIATLLPRFISGTHAHLPLAHVARCKALTIRCPGMTVNLDGELIPCDTAEFSLLKNALRVRKSAQDT